MNIAAMNQAQEFIDKWLKPLCQEMVNLDMGQRIQPGGLLDQLIASLEQAGLGSQANRLAQQMVRDTAVKKSAKEDAERTQLAERLLIKVERHVKEFSEPSDVLKLYLRDAKDGV